MANNSKKNKLFDVAKPGKTPANPSSRPLVVSNRPILKDPMMAEDKGEAKEVDEKDETDKKLSPSRATKIIPAPENGEKSDEEKETTDKPAEQPEEDQEEPEEAEAPDKKVETPEDEQT